MKVYARVFWFYKPEDIPGHGRQSYHGEHELIATNEAAVINASAINGHATVFHWHEESNEALAPGLFWRQTFDAHTGKLSVSCTCDALLILKRIPIVFTNPTGLPFVHSDNNFHLHKPQQLSPPFCCSTPLNPSHLSLTCPNTSCYARMHIGCLLRTITNGLNAAALSIVPPANAKKPKSSNPTARVPTSDHGSSNEDDQRDDRDIEGEIPTYAAVNLARSTTGWKVLIQQSLPSEESPRLEWEERFDCPKCRSRWGW